MVSVPNDTPESKPSRGWFRLENRSVEHIREIGTTAYCVLAVLAKHADERGECWPSEETIAEIIGTSERTVRRCIRTLEKAGLIASTRRRRESIRYQLARLDRTPMSDQEILDRTPMSARPDTHVRQTGHQCPPNKTQEQDPEKEDKKTSAKRFADDDLALARFMVDVMSRVQKPAREPNAEKWADTIRLMRERDGRTIQEIRDLFTWANNHSFWKANIRSPEKLREQWDRLTIQKKESNGHASSNKRAPLQTAGVRHDPTRPIQNDL